MSSIARRLASLGFTRQIYDFAAGALPADVSFTRASAGYRYNSSGVLVSMATDAARFQYDPAALTARGLLIEGAQTNAFLRSEEFDNAGWNKTNTTVTANGAVAPDGTTTMDKLVENSATGTHITYRAMSVVSGTTYAIEVFVKAATRTWCSLAFQTTGFSGVGRTYFNVGAGTLGTVGAGVTAFIQHVGGGIYRCVALAAATSTVSANISIELATADLASPSYAGDGTSGLFLWGATFKAADCVTSYIQTTTAAATRAADVALITNVNMLADQVYIVRGRTPRRVSGGALDVALQIDDGTSNNRRSIRYASDGHLRVVATVGGVDQCDISLGSVAVDTDFTVGARFADNNFAASLNGGAIVTDTSGSNPVGLTTARVGCDASGNYWNSTIRSIESRRTATDADLLRLAA